MKKASKKNKRTIIVLGGANDFHAVDWFNVIAKVGGYRVKFLTDVKSAESMPCLIDETDKRLDGLFLIDRLLAPHKSKWGNVWRNIIKLFLIPAQILYIKRYVNCLDDYIVHAHPMYYMLLCALAGIKYVGTPQGSEILVRSQKSFIYRLGARFALRKAMRVTVDSVQMAKKIKSLSQVDAVIIQNGIDVDEILSNCKLNGPRKSVLSVRGLTELYRIDQIVAARNSQCPDQELKLVFPFHDAPYLATVKTHLKQGDELIGRLGKREFYDLLCNSILAVSVPKTDSSPRSVYEAIFSGCVVATTQNSWIKRLPNRMQSRIVVVDLSDPDWFVNALEKAKIIVASPFIPDKVSIDEFDQFRSLSRAFHMIYDF